MIFFENERSQVRTLRVNFREIARIFTTLGEFDLGWHWLSTYLTAAHYNKTHKKFIRRRMRSSFKRVYFFIIEPKFLKNMRIFKKILAMSMGKSTF